jgi:hypothetical protein
LIYQTRLEGPSSNIDLSHLEKGIYFITVRTKMITKTVKIIKI